MSTHEFCIHHVQAGGSCKWVTDSQRLLLEYFDAIHDSPSQIYHFALPFCPSSSWLRGCFSTELSQEVRVVKGLLDEWGVCSRKVTLGAIPWTIACWKDIIVVGCHTGGITILDGITGTQKAVLSGHTKGVQCLTFSSDGASLVSGSDDETIKLWDVQTGGVVKTFHGHTQNVHSVCISADNTMIASGSSDKTIRSWDIQKEECHHIIQQHESVFFVRLSPIHPQYLISTSGGKLWQWDISGPKIIPTHDSSHIVFSLDQIQVVLCQGIVTVVQHFYDEQLSSCCCLSPGGRLIAVAIGSTIHVWDISSSDPQLCQDLHWIQQ